MSETSTLTGLNPLDDQLPEGWEVSPLGELATLSLGKMLDKKQFTGLNPVSYLRNINVRWDEFDLNDMQVMDITPDQFKRVSLQSGDIVVCEGGEPGRSAVWVGSEPIAIQKALHRVRPHKNLNPRFLYFLFEMEFRGSGDHPLFTGTTIKHLPKEKIATVQIPVPPLAEQERIVEILEEQLSRLAAALESVRVVREKAAQFRRSLLHAAFTGTLTGHNPADGQLPEGWQHVTLNDLVDSKSDIVDGPFGSNLKSSHYTEDGARVIRLQNIGFGSYLDADAFISLEHYDRLSKHNVVAGDLLFASLGENLPRTCLTPDLNGPAIVKADCIRVRLSESIDHQFVLHATQRPDARKWASDQLHGMGRPRLGLGGIREFPVPLPPLAEQEQIVEILEEQLSRLDAALGVADAIEKRSAALRRSLLHAAFTGRLTEQWRESVHV